MSKKYSVSFLLLFFGNIFFINCYTQTSVTLGKQIWMKQNLIVNTFRNGKIIKQSKSAKDWEIATENKTPTWCYVYFNANFAKYGKLYNWYAASDTSGVCPAGWHIPSDNDWAILEDYLATSGSAKFNNFNIIPTYSGWLYDDEDDNYGVDVFHNGTKWWSKTISIGESAWYRGQADNKIYRYDAYVGNGMSIRCVKD